jgi:hypothetical protein
MRGARNAGGCPCWDCGGGSAFTRASELVESRRAIADETDSVAEALVMDQSDYQALTFDPPPTPEGRWLLARERLIDEASYT